MANTFCKSVHHNLPNNRIVLELPSMLVISLFKMSQAYSNKLNNSVVMDVLCSIQVPIL